MQSRDRVVITIVQVEPSFFSGKATDCETRAKENRMSQTQDDDQLFTLFNTEALPIAYLTVVANFFSTSAAVIV